MADDERHPSARPGFEHRSEDWWYEGRGDVGRDPEADRVWLQSDGKYTGKVTVETHNRIQSQSKRMVARRAAKASRRRRRQKQVADEIETIKERVVDLEQGRPPSVAVRRVATIMEAGAATTDTVTLTALDTFVAEYDNAGTSYDFTEYADEFE